VGCLHANWLLAMAHLTESSDGEGVYGLQVPQAVPYDIRSAKRVAATSLLVSAAVCLCSLGAVVHAHTWGAPAVVAPAASSSVGLSEDEPLQQAAAEVDGLLNEARGMQFGARPAPHHLVAPMALRAKASSAGPVQRQLPAGVQVFPLSAKFGWVQVVVPEMELGGVKQNATVGWLQERTDGGAPSLVEDKKLLNRKYNPYMAAPPSEAVIQAKKDAALARHQELQAKVVELQKSLASRPPHSAEADEQPASDEARRSKGGDAAKAEVSKVVVTEELSKTMQQVHSSLAELKADKLFQSIGKALS